MNGYLSKEEYQNRIKLIDSNLSMVDIYNHTGSKDDPFIIHCNICGLDFKKTKKQITSRYKIIKNNSRHIDTWCPACNKRACYPGHNDVATLRPDLIKYFKNKNDAKKYMPHQVVKVDMVCPDCGAPKTYNMSWVSMHGFMCDNCTDGLSYPNKICRALLLQLPLDDYEFEYIDKWTNGKRYDARFKFNDNQYLLEFDGGQHFIDSSWSTKEEQEENDRVKDELAYENGYILIRINCATSDFEYIKNNIIKSELSNIFDMSIIDWEKCYLDSLKNIVFEVAKYYNETHAQLSDVGRYFHMDSNIICKYLKQAAKIGLCDYSPIISKMNSNCRDNIPFVDKSFYAYDPEDNLIGKFNFRSECVKYINENYDGVCMNNTSINTGLWTGVRQKGFLFEFVIGLEEYYKNNNEFYDVCQYFNTNKDKTISDISKKFNIDVNKIRVYLKAGTTLGLCSYEYRYKNNRNSMTKENAKIILHVYKDSNYIGEYYGEKQCVEELNKLFQEDKLTVGSLYSWVHLTRNKEHKFKYKGFEFTYEINDNT